MGKKKFRRVSLEYDGKEMRTNFGWQSLPVLRKQVQFLDRMLGLAELPEREELPKILKVASKHSLPSVWRRARHSTLETMAALLITALAFSSKKEWEQIIRKFLAIHDLKVRLQGRPLKYREDLVEVSRGRAIDEIIARLARGFQIKVEAKRKGGGTIEDEETASKLKEEGLEPEAIDAILKEQRLEGAGCRFYREAHEQTVELRSIKNSYGRYKSLKRQLMR